MTDVFDPASLGRVEQQLDQWLAGFRSENAAIVDIDRGDPGELKWYVRMRGEAKEYITVWLTLGQRTLRYEAYVMPSPVENVAAVYENALRRNERMVGAHFAIGVEDALFIRGELPLVALNEAELDRAIGSLYAYVEESFPTLIGLGYASRFVDERAR